MVRLEGQRFTVAETPGLVQRVGHQCERPAAVTRIAHDDLGQPGRQFKSGVAGGPLDDVVQLFGARRREQDGARLERFREERMLDGMAEEVRAKGDDVSQLVIRLDAREQVVDESLPLVSIVVVGEELLELVDGDHDRLARFRRARLGYRVLELAERVTRRVEVRDQPMLAPDECSSTQRGYHARPHKGALPAGRGADDGNELRSAEPVEDEVDLLVAAVEAIGVVLCVWEEALVGAVAGLGLGSPDQVATRKSRAGNP